MTKQLKLYVKTLIISLILFLLPLNTTYSHNESVYLGGDMIDIHVAFDTPIIYENPKHTKSFKQGDIILRISKNYEPYKKIIKSYMLLVYTHYLTDSDTVLVKVNRQGKELTINSSKFELTGLKYSDQMESVGTLTYIKDDSTFGALAHTVTPENPYCIVKSGEIFSTRSKTGKIKNYDKNTKIGILKNCNNFGIRGNIINSNYINNGRKKCTIGEFEDIKKAKAYLVVKNKNNEFDYIEAEIVKINKKSKNKDKSMMIKIIDKEFLKENGGIIQGMSGTPIIQNNKLIGAISHSTVNDPTIGFAIYIKNMIN